MEDAPSFFQNPKSECPSHFLFKTPLAVAECARFSVVRFCLFQQHDSSWVAIASLCWRTISNRRCGARFARTAAALCEVGQDDARTLEEPTTAGTDLQWEDIRGEGVEAVWSDFTIPRVSLSLEEVMVVARSRVVKLRSVFATLGEDNEASATIQAALQKGSRRKNVPFPNRSRAHSCTLVGRRNVSSRHVRP